MTDLIPENLELLTQKQQGAVKKRIKRVDPTKENINNIYTESELERISKKLEKKEKNVVKPPSKKQKILSKYGVPEEYSKDIKYCLKTGKFSLNLKDMDEDTFKYLYENHIANKNVPKGVEKPTVIDGVNYHGPIRPTNGDFVKKFIDSQQNAAVTN